MISRDFLSVQAPASFKIDYADERVIEALSAQLCHCLRIYGADKELVVLCIGTDRSTGDALGPLVGNALIHMVAYPGFYVYGTIDHPVHAVNLQETLDRIKELHGDPLIIAVDACLGQISNVGKININPGPLKPGAGVKKSSLPEVGTFHITGIVNVGGFMEYFVLQNTRLSVVMKMAEVIALALKEAVTINYHANSSVQRSPFSF